MTRLAASILSALLGTGCVYTGVAATADNVSRSREAGEKINDLQAGMKATWDATLAALKDLSYEYTVRSELDANGGTIAVRDRGNIRIEKHPSLKTLTRVKIRFSTFKDDAKGNEAERILARISYRLGGAGEI